MTNLDLSFNNFSGQIPSSLTNLFNLNTLHLSFNNFNGQIPPSLTNLSKLTTLDLSNNDFNGEIPSDFGRLNKLVELILSFNKLNGTLSPNMNSLSNLEVFDVSHNTFTGTLPFSLFANPKITHIGMSYNQLNGTLAFENLSSTLVNLFLGNNKLRGPIPRSMVKLVNLRSLDLSYLNTQGSIDFSIFSRFKSLNSLDLSHLSSATTFDLNEIFSCFKFVHSLDLSGNHVSSDTNVSVLDNPLLADLYLSRCSLSKFPEFLRTQYKLRFLDISNNEIKGQVPGWLWSPLNLMYVDLSRNKFIGFEKLIYPRLPSTQEPDMRYLFGANNNFRGKIPSFICGLRFLYVLDLSNNKFSGTIPYCLGNCSMTLSFLNLRKNRLSGGLPENLSKSLESLDLGHNQLVGKLPRSLVHISSLKVLNVESNKFNDTFPFWLSSLQELQVFVLRSNAFHGPIQNVGFSRLRIIDISGNQFNGTLSSDFFLKWISTFSLGITEDKSNRQHLGTSYYTDAIVLMNKGIAVELVNTLNISTAIDFSRNKFEGKIPSSIGLMKELTVLNLSNNAFSGHIPSTMANLMELELVDLSNNNLTGNIPYFICGLRLTILNLANNKFSGSIPYCFGNFSMTLEALILRKNCLSGVIPENLSKSLVSLDLGHNQLVGKLPRSLVDIYSLEVFNVEGNQINDTFPFWLHSLTRLKVLVLRSNAFHGPIHKFGFSKLSIIDISSNQLNGVLPPDCFLNWTAMFSLGVTEDLSKGEYMGTNYYTDSMVLMNKSITMQLVRILKIFTALDFSGNKFEGEIPSSIGFLKELHVLNLSNNAFSGHIPSTMANLVELESLDVSQNKLSGNIPQELGQLSFLSYMDFSHNKLVGPIPEGTQFQTQRCSSFEENIGLFGPTLDRVCGDMYQKTSQQSEMREEGKDEEVLISWIAVAIGVIPGISFGFTMGYILLSYKPKWFSNTFGSIRHRSIRTTTH